MEIAEVLKEREERSEKVLELCREIKKKAAVAIEELVEGKEAEVNFEEEMKKLNKMLEEDPILRELLSGSIRITMQEAAEALIVEKAIKENKIELPNFEEHAVLTGLADAIGELKRYFLKSLIKGNKEEAKRALKLAEEGYRILAKIHFSPKVVPELKRKRDVARGVVTSMLEIIAKS